MNAFDKYLNETMNMLNERSINKIQAEFTEVVNKMSAMAKEYAAAEGDEKTNILAELKGLTSKKNDLIKELDLAVAGKDKDVQLAIKESEVTEAYGKPAGLTKDETMEVAQKFADAMSKVDGTKVTVNKRTLEEDSFDLDIDGEEFDGGSYNIYQNGNVMNMAVPSNPVYGKKNDTVDTIVKNMKKMIGESIVTEAKALSLDKLTSMIGDKPSCYDLADFIYTNYDKVTGLRKSMRNDEMDFPEEIIDLVDHYGFDIDDFTDKYGMAAESIVTESKITLKRQYTENHPAVTVGKNAAIRNKVLEFIKNGRITAEAFENFVAGLSNDSKRWTKNNSKYFTISEEGVSLSKFGQRILKSITVNESNNETGLMVIGRTSADNNKIGKIVDELGFHAEWNSKEGYWLFPEEEDMYDELETELDKAFTKKNVNARFEGIFEATKKNPEIWVPGGFDKEIGKYPNNKITKEIVLKAAKKWDVDPSEAIPYVEFGWAIDLSENKNTNTNMKIKFIYESFQEFVENKLNEGTLNEAFASAKLASLLTGAYAMPKDLPKAFYNMSKLALDKIQDIDIIEMTPDQAKKEKRASAVYLYFTTNEKENPYAGKSAWSDQKNIPANTLLAITDGSNEWMNAEWSRYNRRQSQKDGRVLTTTKRNDSAGISKSGASDQYGTGISSMKQVAELADRAYCLDLTILKARYSTEAQRAERVEAKKGATALMDPRTFKDANKQRYNEILATKASAMPMDSIVLGAIDTLSEQIKDAIAKGEKGQYGDILIGTDQRGKEVKLNDASNLMRNILDEYSRYCGSVSQNEAEKAAGYGGTYYEGAMKQQAKNITDYVKKIETKSYGW